MSLVVDDHHVTVTNRTLAALFVEGVEDANGRMHRLGATLPRGCSLRFARRDGTSLLHGRGVSGIDLVCPRQHAPIRYAGADGDVPENHDALPPDHEDERASFP